MEERGESEGKGGQRRKGVTTGEKKG